MTKQSLREVAEDLRDGAAKLAAAVIGGRIDDAAYSFHALICDTVEELELELRAALIRRS